jgi:hypothetical protein
MENQRVHGRENTLILALLVSVFWLPILGVEALLTCRGCAPGEFVSLNGSQPVCTRCPEHSTTLAYANATAATDCICVPGYTSLVRERSLDQCSSCELGYFKTTPGNETCQPCPAHTNTTVRGAIGEESCLCNPGFFLGPGGLCEKCEPGTYKETVRNGACDSCDVNADSELGSTTVVACLCNAGFAGDPGAPCVACEPGKYRVHGPQYICESCPVDSYNVLAASDSASHCLGCPNFTSTEGSSGASSLLQCTCNAGYRKHLKEDELGASWACAECGVGTYQSRPNQSSCALCNPGKYANQMAAATDPCSLCADGSFSTESGASACVECGYSTWQNLSMGGATALPCSLCPPNSTSSVLGSTTVHSCTCDPGFVLRFEPYRCDACPAGAYCPAAGASLTCPPSTWSAAGASSCTTCGPDSRGVFETGLTAPGQCQCVPGYEGAGDHDCSACAPGKFQDVDYTYTGSTGITQSINVTCSVCPSNTYQELRNATACNTCPGNSSSPSGSDAVHDCLCDGGFFGSLVDVTQTCTLCPVNTFCSGGKPEPESCRPFSSAPAGQDASEDCICDAGYYSLNTSSSCTVCPPNSFCEGGLRQELCPGNSSSLRGSKSVEACQCVPGMWRGCTPSGSGTFLDQAGEDCVIEYTEACYPCPPDTICYNETLLHCPEHSLAPPSSSETDDCVCTDGYFNDYVI